MYLARGGETFLEVSRRVYGDDLHEVSIRNANPGLFEPIRAGTQVYLTLDGGLLSETQGIAFSSEPDEVIVFVGTKRFDRWIELIFTSRFDGVAELQMKVAFDPTGVHEDVFTPLAYEDIIIYSNGVVFSGTVVNLDPRLESGQRVLIVQAYADCGVLFDCSAPASMTNALQFENQTLPAIADTLLEPFGIRTSFEATDYNTSPIDRIGIDADEIIGGFLVNIAREKKLVIGSDSRGRLAFRNDVGTKPISAVFTEGESPFEKLKLHLNQREYFSHVSGVVRKSEGTVFLNTDDRRPQTVTTSTASVFRPKTIVINTTEDASVSDSVSAAIGRMNANVATWSYQLPSWINQRGELWEAGQRVQIKAPSVFIDREYELTVREVTYRVNKDRKTVRLDLMPPQVIATGQMVDNFPWQPARIQSPRLQRSGVQT